MNVVSEFASVWNMQLYSSKEIAVTMRLGKWTHDVDVDAVKTAFEKRELIKRSNGVPIKVLGHHKPQPPTHFC